MRFLFTSTPAFSQTTPLIPLAQAARLQGHQVLFAAGGDSLPTAAEAGLPVLDAAPDADVTAPYRRFAATAMEREPTYAETMELLSDAFAEIGETLLPGLEAAARDWRADVVLYPPMLPAAGLAARAAGSLAVLHEIGLRHPPFPLRGARARESGESAAPVPDAGVALGPDSLERFNSMVRPGDAPPYPVLPMRPGTHNGGGPVPTWALRAGSRPRVLLTMGSVPEHVRAQGPLLAELAKGAEGALDAEVVVTTLGTGVGREPGASGERRRAVDFLPLGALLPTCAAVVHHGGMSTMLSALAAGVPQVIVTTTRGDALSNAEAVRQRGAGVRLEPSACSAGAAGEAVRAVVRDPAYRAASVRVAAELAARPGPQDVAGRLARRAAAR
ncbi:glycosyltransferase [Streptomyces boncukensis]|uniref:Glycosyltransferase family 1 protein n=1 Tax=Streptomyces boncukensis TaxID=2711219 RepID=A0A6G4WQM0_9ACTN|nr:glycosyltransferase [Streptomyces boncukensis]NGO67569.1 glycosyltransferase family 1 protein [Streptomyces boncukensis]